ncbi:MAG: hypothetical protein IAG13_27500 [Deltaproteobacteria bacterium]|nr:hypothetical protein [Nannocystaceae bacterium]
MPTPRTLRTLLLGGLFGLVVGTSCDPGTVTPGGVAAAAAGCPDLSSVSAIAKVDFVKEFAVDAKVGAQLKGGLEAAAEIQGFAAKLDKDLAGACGGLAKDLGKSGDYDKGPDACKAAISAMADVRGKLGGSAKIALAIEPPRCSTSLDAMTECLGKCDAAIQGGSVAVKCEKGKLVGTCDAQCSGTCELDVAAKCEGTCKGSCEASFSGKCGGECNGKCNGKGMQGGQCNGTCEGKCSAQADGKCGGKCSGGCEMSGGAKCSGKCRGECSVAMKAPHCEGAIEPPRVSAECQARCATEVSAKVECTKGNVAVRIDGGADAKAVAQYKGALEKHMPAILKIAIGMKDQAVEVAGSVKAVVSGAQSAVASVKGDPQIGAKLTACVAAPFKAALDAAASVKANIDVSVEVKASASASASGSASGSAGG